MHDFLIYRASAGTGKTFSLVKEYLSIILREPEGFRRTLAITFTNKAAEEMKSRILTYLSDIANGKNEPDSETWNAMVPALMETIGMSETELIEKSRAVLENILHNYSFFSIGTIDSFSNALVQTFAREMNLPLEFKLELDADEIISRAVDMLIAKAGEGEIITDILIDFARKKISENRHYNIVNDLKTFAQRMLKEDGVDQRKQLEAYDLPDLLEFNKKINAFLEQYKRRISDISNPIWEKIKEITNFFAHGNRGIPSFFKKLVKDPSEFPSRTNSDKTVESGKWTSSKATAYEKLTVETLAPEIEKAYLEIIDFQDKNRAKVIIFQNILKNFHATMLLNEISHFISEIREMNGIVHISELNKRIADTISKESVPYIYERIGSRYHNYMIDEFQDTSVLQWHNFVPLVLNALSENGLSMIVGDGKQAIYRWRNGDVEQFERLSSLTEQAPKDNAERSFKEYINLKRLHTNFRSEKAIVDFSNKLFEFAKQYIPTEYQELKNVYSDLTLDPLPRRSGGFVSICFISDDDERSYEENMCETTWQTIQNLTERGFSWNDIAVLCRTNNESSTIAQYLTEHDISVASSESLLLTSSDEINILCAALNYCAFPNISNKIIFWLALWKNKNLAWDDSIIENIDNIEKTEFRKFLKDQGFDIDFDALSGSTLFDAAASLMIAFHFNPAENIYLRFFLDGIVKAQTNGISSVNDFPKWWKKEGTKLSLIIPENTNAIKVTTIHKAKGLGFPVVVYPFADADFKKSEDTIWIDLDETQYFLPATLLSLNKDLLDTDFASYYNEETAKSSLDMLNVFYVACTRPKKELHIISKNKKIWKEENPSMADILHNFLVNEAMWEDDKETYLFGESILQTEKEAENIPDNQYFMKNIIPWQERISIRRYSDRMWNSRQIDYGNMVHSILEKIETADDIKPVIHRFLATGAFPEIDMEKIENILQNIIFHPELEHFFQKGNTILRETAILLPENREIRPDRAVIKGNEVHIVDYKTGSYNPEHENQLRDYSKAILQMGYEVVSGRLVYIRDEEVTVSEVR
ncbi:MAG: UvrD-helicase domain-containing protein [Bacteroidales bacterium]|jgi:ATP-dependent exoDNAse (exonuclease V) beta subunit|nr:UvrD-helicase domain-containing protein [Bacteroidales bacterium]